MRMMVAAAAALAFGAIAPASGTAQTAADSTSGLEGRVDSLFAEFDHTNSIGCALGIVRSGRLIYRRGYGMADVERRVPMTPQTLVDIGSVSKQFTAMAIMMLADRKQLSLDDDIRKYVPELPQYERPITLRHLIHHTSGLRDYLTLLYLSGLDFSDVATDDDGLAILKRQRSLDFTPGAEYSYSNSGYFLLTFVIKQVTGRTFRDFAREEFFDPLGMTHTLVHDYASLIPNRAVGYSRTPQGDLQVEIWRFTQTGDGAIFTSIEDLVHWDQNFYTGEVGGAAVMAEMHRTGVLNDGRNITYAGGNNVSRYRGLRRVSHTGGGGGFSSAITRFPDQRFSVLVSCNQDGANAGRKAQEVADLYLAGDFTEPAEPAAASGPSQLTDSAVSSPGLTSAELARYAGEYWSDELGVAYRVEVVEEKLALRVGRKPSQVLAARAADTFAGAYTVVKFTRDRRGQVAGFLLSAGRIQNLRFERTSRTRP